MHRLIEKGLMFGNLIRVDSPILVERYNRALMHLTGLETQQDVFHIDISGYSPELGDEFDDQLYLNHAGVNRQFILLTTEQVTAPLLHTKFSTARGILMQFITENRTQLFALTARDAVAGEMVNSVYLADTPARLFDIRKIKIEADTTTGTVAMADKLGKKIDKFKTDQDAWFDDVLIAEMIGMAKQTGDVMRNPVHLRKMEFDQDNYWSDLFGGIYLFRGVDHPAAIVATDKDAVGALPIDFTFDLNDRSAIAKFLKLNDLVEPIVDARGVDAAAILHQKMDFIVMEVAATIGLNMVTAATPSTPITNTGAPSERSAERPAARVTTSSLLRARPMNRTMVDRIISNGRISLIAEGAFSSIRRKSWPNVTSTPSNFLSCSIRSINMISVRKTAPIIRKLTRKRLAKYRSRIMSLPRLVWQCWI